MDKIASFKIISHHVGGRNGTIGLPVLPFFESDIVNILYDADESCVAHAQYQWTARKSETLGVHAFLSDREGRKRFKIRYDPYSSGSLDINKKFNDYYLYSAGVDYMMSDAGRVVQEIEVETTSLDTLVNSEKVPSPDFLSIDVEGGEFDVILGARESLSRSCLAVMTEVSFDDLRVNQKQFSDIDGLLKKSDFGLVQIYQHADWSPLRAPVGFRAGGSLVTADVLHFKCIDSIVADAESGRDALVKLSKLALIAVTFGQLEFAIMCLKRAEEAACDFDRHSVLDQTGYGRFLEKLLSYYREAPPVYPPLFSEMNTPEGSADRFQLPEESERFRDWLRRDPLRATGYFLSAHIRLLTKRLSVKNRFDAFQAFIRPRESDNRFEAMLREYGLVELAETVKMRRVEMSLAIKKSGLN